MPGLNKDIWCHTRHLYSHQHLSVWFKYDLGQKYYAPQVQPEQGLTHEPPDHDILPLDVDSINESDSVANPDPTPRIASVHKSRFAEVWLVDVGWRLFTTVYYYVNGKTRRVHSSDVFYWAWITRTWRDAWTIYVTHVIDTRSIRARMQSRRRCILLWLGKYWISRGEMCYFKVIRGDLRFDGLSLRFWQKTNSFALAHSCVFSQTSTRVHQILIPTHNHEVTLSTFHVTEMRTDIISFRIITFFTSIFLALFL